MDRKNKMTISCVLFVYNEEAYIQEAIESVLRQTLYVDQIIVCDDFSTDGTVKKVNDIAANHSRVKYVQSAKKGKFYAYQTGLKQVNTDYFFILAGDDALEPNYVEMGMSFLEGIPQNFFYSAYKICNDQLVPQQEFYGIKQKYNTKDLLPRNWVGGFLFSSSINIPYLLKIDDDRITFEDWVGVIMFSKLYGEVFFSPNANYLYRRHDAATTVVLDRKKLRKRDIKLYSYLLSSELINLDKDELDLVEKRMMFNSIMVGETHSTREKISLMFSTALKFKDKVKLILFVLGIRE